MTARVVINFSATCDPGYCIDNSEQVFCQLPKAIAYNTVSTPSAKSLDRCGKKSTSNNECILGTYSCNYEDLVLVCDALGNLQVSAVCWPWVCISDNGWAWCTGNKAASDNIASTSVAKSLDKRAIADDCVPATQQCSSDDSQILTCDDNDSWEMVGFCGDGRHCMYSASGMPFCINNAARDIS